jgi:uncharacterized membrane protein
MTSHILKTLAISATALAITLTPSHSAAQGRIAGQRRQQLGPATAELPGSATVVNFGTVDFPGAPDSAAYAINDHGQILGGYGPDLQTNAPNTGFYLNRNAFQEIDFPGAAQTAAFGLNNVGEISGTYIDVAGNYHGFNLVKGIYTGVDVPGAVLTQAQGVNDSGEIVGLYYDSGSNAGQGFALNGSTFTTIDMPGATGGTYCVGVNNSGEIVGEYIDSAGDYHGFLWVSGVFSTIDYPGAAYSALFGITESGVVVGTYRDGVHNIYEGFEHGYAYNEGQYLSVDVPFVGAGSTAVSGINKRGQIVGYYIDTDGRNYGYSAQIVP